VGVGQTSTPRLLGTALRPSRRLGLFGDRRANPLGNAIRVAQRSEFIGGEQTPSSRTQPFDADACKCQTGESEHLEVRGLSHSSDLLVAPFVQHDLDPGFSVLETNDFDLGRQGLVPVVEHYAVAPTLYIGVGHFALELDQVAFWYALGWVEHRGCELTVVGQKQGTARLEVESSDGIESGA
jgi:hypothetical protein